MIRRGMMLAAVVMLVAAGGAWAFADGGAYLGVEVVKLTDAWRTRLGCEGSGVVVVGVDEGSPAEVAGIEDGDVIRRLDGDAVTSPARLVRLIGEKGPKAVVKIDVFHAGKETTLSATLDEAPEKLGDMPRRIRKFLYMPDEGGRAVVSTHVLGSEPDRWIGVRITELEEARAKEMGIDGGLRVAEVIVGAPAEKAGVEAGDAILEVNGSSAADADALKDAVGNTEIGGVVSLKISRNGEEKTIDVKVEEHPAATERNTRILSWVRELQDSLGVPPAAGMEHGKGMPCGRECEAHAEMEKLRAQIEELRARLDKAEKELKELREKVE